MNEEPNNELQQSDLENNPVNQMEQQVASKMKNVVRDAANRAKDMAAKAIKKAIKLAIKALFHVVKILFTVPPICFVTWAIVIGILIITLILSAYNGITSIFKRDIESGDVSTIEQNVSIYEDEENNVVQDSIFTGQASSDIVDNAKQIKEYIQSRYHYRNGNTMNYPLQIGEKDESGYGIDCSTYVTWVLIMSGYTEFEGKSQLTTLDFVNWIEGKGGYNFSKYGWTYHKVSEKNLTVNPGDLLLKTSVSRHIEIYAGNGTYGAGSNHQIQNKDYKSYIGCSIQRTINLR